MKDESADLWYRYESEGLNELRMDERFDSDANGHLDAGDGWRVVRYTVHGPGRIAHELRETRYSYFGATDVPLETTTFYYHFDRLGNVLALSDDSGTLLETYTTDAFGVDQAHWSQDAFTLRRITGKEYDPDVGLYFFEARWLDPFTGSLVCPVPGGSGDPITQYAFSRNSPAVLIDQTGHMARRPAYPETFEFPPNRVKGECNRGLYAAMTDDAAKKLIAKEVTKSCLRVVGKDRDQREGEILEPALHERMWNRCWRSGTIECQCNDKSRCGQGSWGHGSPGFKGVDMLNGSSVALCVENIPSNVEGDTVIHEFAHTCGWMHDDREWKSDGVPYREGGID